MTSVFQSSVERTESLVPFDTISNQPRSIIRVYSRSCARARLTSPTAQPPSKHQTNMMMRLSNLALALHFTSSSTLAFQRAPFVVVSSQKSATSLSAEKSYGPGASSPLKDLIDNEGAMKEFFESNEDWWPIFRSVASSAEAPAMSLLGGTHGDEIDFTGSTPWEELQQQPSDEQDRTVLAAFLDAMQQSLLDIPVDELVENDDNDLHFLEEGRRMLALNRFHVLRDNSGGSIENFDSLFKTVWSELALLLKLGEESSGSLILLPDYELADLRRFTDMNLLRPLEWLGLDDVFEVSSLERESPAIRLIHKLTDMPTDAYLDELEVEAAAQYEAEKAAKEAAAKKENEDKQ